MVRGLAEGSHSLVNILWPSGGLNAEARRFAGPLFPSNSIIPDWVQPFTHVFAGMLPIVLGELRGFEQGWGLTVFLELREHQRPGYAILKTAPVTALKSSTWINLLLFALLGL